MSSGVSVVPVPPAAAAHPAPSAFPPSRELTRESLRTVEFRVFGSHLLMGLIAFGTSSLVGQEAWWTQVPFCAASLLALLFLIARTVRANPSGLLQEMGIFLSISVWIYFAFGPLLFVFGPGEAIAYARQWHPVDASQALRLTGMNFLGLGIAGVSYTYVSFAAIGRLAERTSTSLASIPPIVIFLAFAISGAAAKFLLVLPFDMRMTQSVPSGITRQCDSLLIIAIMIGAATRSNGPLWIKAAARVLLVAQVTTSLLMFNKNASLLPLIAYGFGSYISTRDVRRLAAACVASLALYIFLVPIVSFGRVELSPRSSSEPAPADLAERRDIVLRYFHGDASNRPENRVQGAWWSRLCYTSAQQAGVDLYDRGDGGDDFVRLPWLILPRFLFPEKPEMTIAGIDFNEKVAGYRSTSTGTGVFLDGYYNLGWPGFLFACTSYGLILRAFASIAGPVLRHRSMIMFPLVFMGIHVALRADGWWLADVAGPLVFALAALAGLMLFSREGARSRQPPPRFGQKGEGFASSQARIHGKR